MRKMVQRKGKNLSGRYRGVKIPGGSDERTVPEKPTHQQGRKVPPSIGGEKRQELVRGGENARRPGLSSEKRGKFSFRRRKRTSSCAP